MSTDRALRALQSALHLLAAAFVIRRVPASRAFSRPVLGSGPGGGAGWLWVGREHAARASSPPCGASAQLRSSGVPRLLLNLP